MKTYAANVRTAVQIFTGMSAENVRLSREIWSPDTYAHTTFCYVGPVQNANARKKVARFIGNPFWRSLKPFSSVLA
jgi:hypothetical protein